MTVSIPVGILVTLGVWVLCIGIVVSVIKIQEYFDKKKKKGN